LVFVADHLLTALALQQHRHPVAHVVGEHRQPLAVAPALQQQDLLALERLDHLLGRRPDDLAYAGRVAHSRPPLRLAAGCVVAGGRSFQALPLIRSRQRRWKLRMLPSSGQVRFISPGMPEPLKYSDSLTGISPPRPSW